MSPRVRSSAPTAWGTGDLDVLDPGRSRIGLGGRPRASAA